MTLFPPARVTRVIIALNVVVAVVSALSLFSGGPDFLREWMPLSLETLQQGQWWRVFSYMWIHAQVDGPGLMHILFNMMTLAPFARVVEAVLGPVRMIILYLSGGVAGAFFFVLEMGMREVWGGGEILAEVPVVGASAAVLAVVTMFALIYPSAPLMLFFLPFRIRAIRVVQGFALASVVLMLSSSLVWVAHSAHLGGIVAGWWWARRWLRPPERPLPPHLAADHPIPDPGDGIVLESGDLSPEQIRLEVDRVLEKIAREGIHSLTAEERAILRIARERL